MVDDLELYLETPEERPQGRARMVSQQAYGDM